MTLTFSPAIDCGALSDVALPNVVQFSANPIFQPVSVPIPHGLPRLVDQRQIGWAIRIDGTIVESSLDDVHAAKAGLIVALRGNAVGTFSIWAFEEIAYRTCYIDGTPEFEPLGDRPGAIPAMRYSLNIISNDPAVYGSGATSMATTNLTAYPFEFPDITTAGRIVYHLNRSGRDLTVKQLCVSGHDGSLTGTGNTSVEVTNGSDTFALSLAYGDTSKDIEGEVLWPDGTEIRIKAGVSSASAQHSNIRGFVLAEG